MADETRADVQQVSGERRVEPAGRRATSTKTSAWVLTAWMVLAPLLMLVTVWLLLVFRGGK